MGSRERREDATKVAWNSWTVGRMAGIYTTSPTPDLSHPGGEGVSPIQDCCAPNLSHRIRCRIRFSEQRLALSGVYTRETDAAHRPEVFTK